MFSPTLLVLSSKHCQRMGKKLHSKNKSRSQESRRATERVNTAKGRENNRGFSVSLPKEVEHEILTRLPVKSLLQFRTVSKQWKLVIDNPSFSDKHLSRAHTRPGVGRMLISFSNLDGRKHYFFSVGLRGGAAVHHLALPGCNKGSNSPCQCHVSESINGLICFSNGHGVYVCNPATRSVQALPNSPVSHWYASVDPFLYNFYSSYSFGFDPATKQYKVLHIMGRYQRTGMKFCEFQCEVFTIDTTKRGEKLDGSALQWRKTIHVPPYPYPFKSHGVCVNGVIYWVGMSAPSVEVLVGFDVASKRFQLISLPVGFSPESNLTQVGGRLALLACKDIGGNTSSIELWILENNSKYMWVRKTCVVPCYQKQVKNLAFLGNIYTAEMLLTPDILQHTYFLVPYHSKKTGVLKVRITGLPAFVEVNGEKNINFRITNHVESFLPIENRRLIQFGAFAVYVNA